MVSYPETLIDPMIVDLFCDVIEAQSTLILPILPTRTIFGRFVEPIRSLQTSHSGA